MTRVAIALALLLGLGGCGGKLVQLAKQGRWQELDDRASAMKRTPRGKAARAWARALVELGEIERARAVLLHDFRSGGQEASLLELAALESSLGLAGMAAAHYTRLYAIDDQDLRDSPHAADACEKFRLRAQALARLGEPLAADRDLRRLAGTCPSAVTEADRVLLASVEPDAEQQARAQRSLVGDELSVEAESAGAAELRLAEALMLARKRSPRAVLALADAEQIQLEPDDVALLLGAEFAGALGPGLVSSRRLSGWVGDNDVAVVVDAIATLPDGVREYAFLRLAGVRHSDRLGDDREAWIVAAMAASDGLGPREAAMAWRVAASTGDLASAEFILNTNLRGLAVKPEPGAVAVGPAQPWWMTVPVDRQTFDLLLSLARLFELRDEKQHEVLALRRRVIADGYEAGLSQVAEVAIEEVVRQLILGHPWQALAIAEVVPGPLVEELLPTVASSLGLVTALNPEQADAVDRQVVARTLGDEWVATWQTRIAAQDHVQSLEDAQGCPGLERWLDPDAADSLRAVGLDPEASRSALELALADLDAPAVAPALTRVLEADVALACSGPVVIPLLDAGLHELALSTLDERLIHVPELDASLQEQLHAELALGHGQFDRAALLTTTAAATSGDPRSLWARAAVAGRDQGAREYMLEALRQVLLHSPGLRDDAARRELLLTRLRDVDHDAILRDTDAESSATQATLDELRRAIADWLLEAPIQRRWALLDGLILQLAGESRTDALAWSLLAELLLDPETRARHPAAAEAFDRAVARAESGSEGGGSELEASQGKLATTREFAFLSDAAALCELASAELDIGAAAACEPRSRAHALADLLASAAPDQREALRARLLAGLQAVEIDPARPGSLVTVPALAREGLLLRVLFGLPIDHAWIVEAPARDRLAGRSPRG
jgi:tetratricopeptide (TPR) repeat protein